MDKIEEKIKGLQDDLKQTMEQLNLWTVKKFRLEGAIESLTELTKVETKVEEKKK